MNPGAASSTAMPRAPTITPTATGTRSPDDRPILEDRHDPD
jgi:hypothetical protein